MSAEIKQEPIKQVIGKDGKPVPGLYSFENLPRDVAIEAEIVDFILNAELQEKLKEMEKSLRP